MIEALKQAPPPAMPTYSSGGGGINNNSSDSLSRDFTSSSHTSTNSEQDFQPNHEDIAKLVDELNESSQSMDLTVKFAFNDKLGEVYVNVVDKNSGEVIRQLPTEESMKLKESMKEYVGSIFDTKG